MSPSASRRPAPLLFSKSLIVYNEMKKRCTAESDALQTQIENFTHSVCVSGLTEEILPSSVCTVCVCVRVSVCVCALVSNWAGPRIVSGNSRQQERIPSSVPGTFSKRTTPGLCALFHPCWWDTWRKIDSWPGCVPAVCVSRSHEEPCRNNHSRFHRWSTSSARGKTCNF